MKIVHKLLLSFLVFVLLIWLVGYLAVSRSEDALKIQIGKRFSSLAGRILAEIEKDINSKIELFQEYSKDLTLQSGTSESNQEFEKLDNIQAYIDKKDHEWTSVSKETITPFMQKLISSKLSEELREKTEFYEEKHGHRVFAEVFVTNIYGANIAQTGKTTDYRQDDEQWWQKAKRDGVYVADIEYDESANVYSIDIGIRIDDKNGTFAGVMKVVLNVEEVGHIIKEVQESSEYETIEVHLVNRDGEVIASTHHSFAEDLCDKQFLKKMDNDRGYFEGRGHGRDKANVLFSYAVSKGYKAFRGLGWILFVEHRTDEIFMPVTELRNNILVISVIVTIFAILISFFISRNISDPVTKLKNAAIEIGKGKLDIEIEVESHDEIGQLAGAFKNMTEDLKKTTTSIDRLNKEILEHKKSDNALAQRSYALGKRVKELNCLYGISKVLEKPGISLEKTVQETADLIPPASQYPEITCARIILDGQEYKTEKFRETIWKLTSDIMVHGKRIGAVEAYYLEEKPEIDEGPFLKEEKNLIDAISERLGKVIERKQTEEEKKKLETQILQSEKMAAIGQLAAGVAHEINNPTGFVSSNLKTLSDYQNDMFSLIKEYKKLIADLKEAMPTAEYPGSIPEQMEQIVALESKVDINYILDDIPNLIEESQEGTERIKRIVIDLKDFAHPGEQDPEYADINKNLDSTLNIVWNELKYKATVTKDYGELPEVRCYPQQLNQVFMNILVNAAQAIEKQGKIRIATRALDGQVEIAISDTGSGIPKENLSKIFDPFFTTREVGKGTGLGLNVAYNIIQKHKGTIDVKSQVGKGTMFIIRLQTDPDIGE